MLAEENFSAERLKHPAALIAKGSPLFRRVLAEAGGGVPPGKMPLSFFREIPPRFSSLSSG
jgi:hypothetical protein